MKPPKVYTPFDRPTGEILSCEGDECRTQQHFAEECDINAIMKRYEQTGILDPALIDQRQAVFADFSDGTDFMQIQDRLAAVRTTFEQLPANVRNRFNNNPAALIDFLADERNTEEAIALGLAARVEQTPRPGSASDAPGGSAPITPKPTDTPDTVSVRTVKSSTDVRTPPGSASEPGAKA